MSNFLSKKQPDMNFENLFKPVNIAMKLNRTHPDIKKNWRWACQFSLLYGLFFLIFCMLVYSIIFQDFKKNDFTQACSNGILCVIFSIVTFNNLVFFWYYDVFKKLRAKMNRDYEEANNFAEEEISVVQNYAEKGRWIIKLWIVISTSCVALFPIKSLGLMVYYTTVHEFRLVPIYDLTYPDFVEEVKNELPVYLVLSLVFLYFGLYAIMTYSGFVPLGSILLLHACGQLKLANMRVRRIFKENHRSEDIIIQLKNIVIMINDIYSFIKNIQKSFKVLYELTSKATIVILPISFYQVLQSFYIGEIKIEFFTIILGSITLISIPCYYSDMLMESGKELSLAVYSCGWEEHWDKQCQTFVLIVLMRTSESAAIRTLFRDFCLDALTDIYQQSYAIFNLLNAVW